MKLLLVRHAHRGDVGLRLAGRAGGHHLTDAGREDAYKLGRRLAGVPLAAVYASPLERAQETATALARPHGLAVATLSALNELDYGDWTGRSFAELEADAAWREWNTARATAQIPGGESMRDAQARMVEGLQQLAASRAGQVVAAVTHSGVVKAALAFWLGMPLELLDRLEIAPASTSGVAFDGRAPRVLWVNESGDLARAIAQ